MEGNWTWAYTHEPFDYTDWAPGEPNSLKGSQNGVVVVVFKSLIYMVN